MDNTNSKDRRSILRRFIKDIESGKLKIDHNNTATKKLLEERGSEHV